MCLRPFDRVSLVFTSARPVTVTVTPVAVRPVPRLSGWRLPCRAEPRLARVRRQLLLVLHVQDLVARGQEGVSDGASGRRPRSHPPPVRGFVRQTRSVRSLNGAI